MPITQKVPTKLPEMRADEAMLLKCFGSEHNRARFTAHSAFDDPTSDANAPPRESIEVRILAFFLNPGLVSL